MIPWAVYNAILNDSDDGLFAFGQLIFTVAVLFINMKLL